MSNFVDVTPDVDLLANIRHSSIDNLSALGELIDNSVDAGSRNITVQFYDNEKYRNIMVVDDGRGISEPNIKHALTLAKSMKVGMDQLGRFGMGMKTAALSLTTNFELFTKSVTDGIFYASYNINKMKQENKFIAEIRPATAAESDFFKTKIKSLSGTIVILKNCDRINYKTNEDFSDKAIRYIGQVYRRQISRRGVQFEVITNNTPPVKVPMIDPLMRDDSRVVYLANCDIHEINYTQNQIIKKTNIEVSATLLPEGINNEQLYLKLNQANQGIYILREGREIANAKKYNTIWKESHNSKNRLRIEVVVNTDLDNELRIDFNKGQGNPTVEFKEQLQKIIEPIMQKYMKLTQPSGPGGPRPGPVTGPMPSPPNPSPTSPGPTNPGPTNPPKPGPLNPPKPGPTSPPPVSPTPATPPVVVTLPPTAPGGNGSRYEILENVAVFSQKGEYTLELNIVSWGGSEPVFDLRSWNHAKGIAREGISLTKQEAIHLKDFFGQIQIK